MPAKKAATALPRGPAKRPASPKNFDSTAWSAPAARRRVVGATEFKAKCLAIFDDIEQLGQSVTITRRGKPVATIGPARNEKWRNPMGILQGAGEIIGDDIYTDIFGVFKKDRGKLA